MELVLEELSECIAAGGDVERAVEEQMLGESINRFVKALPQPEQQVFLCRYFYMDGVEDIAKRFGFTQSKVKSMLHRTRAKLRKFLEKEGMV